MKLHALCILLATSLSGVGARAAAEEPVELVWKPTQAPMGYALWQAPADRGPPVDIDALADGGAPDPAALRAPVKLEPPKLGLVLQRRGQKLNAQMVALEDLTPKAWKGGGPVKQLQAGTLQDVCDLELDGRVASFWKPQRTRNLLAILFELPRGPVKVGDSWSIEVHLLELGLGAAIPTREARSNRVRLTALRKEGEDLVATIDYAIAESVSAPDPLKLGTSAETFDMRAAFVGRGEFYVNKGRWKQLDGWMAIDGGMGPGKQLAFIGLRWTTPIPAAFTKPLLPLK